MKKKIAKILLFMLPFMALLLATTGNSVQMVNIATGEKVLGSYFVMLNDTTAAMCPVLAATCSILSLIAALIFVFSKKTGFLKTSAWISFAGACLAVIPVVAKSEFLILPHVLFPVLLLAHFVLCAFSKKLGLEQKEAPAAPRLERH